MPARIKRFLVSISFLMLVGCGIFASKRELPDFPLLPPADYFLLQDAGSQPNLQALQITERVNIQINGDEHVLLAAWVIDNHEMRLVGLTPTGQRLMTLRYDGEQFEEAYTPLVVDPIPGRQVLSHLQMAQWPTASIDKALVKSEWRLEVADGERHFFLGNTLILIVKKQDDSIVITSPVMDYRLQATRLN